ncbi:Low-density lipoprotein receptor-related protein 1B, partial [Trachymyrmex zeteki]
SFILSFSVTTCSGDQFRCLDGICLSIDKRCNGIANCRNGEDENQCGCGDTEFRCTDGHCISYVLQCNGVNECSDGSDERDCGNYATSHSSTRSFFHTIQKHTYTNLHHTCERARDKSFNKYIHNVASCIWTVYTERHLS